MLLNFISLIFPKACLGCNHYLYKHEDLICSKCLHQLPRTFLEKEKKNTIKKLLWDSLKIECCTAHYFYINDSNIQKLIQKLKYKNKPEIGVHLGRKVAEDLLKSSFFKNITTLIPIPLHPKKIYIRGYNQSKKIAIGIYEKTKINIEHNVLFRKKHNISQTKKSVFDRWQNSENLFAIKNKEKLENKHVLIIDDVITTGSTLQFAILELEKIKNIKISVLCLAISKN